MLRKKLHKFISTLIAFDKYYDMSALSYGTGYRVSSIRHFKSGEGPRDGIGKRAGFPREIGNVTCDKHDSHSRSQSNYCFPAILFFSLHL